MAKELLCINCGYQGRPKRITRGSILIELVLWVLIIPGLVYSLWRLTSGRQMVCPSCREPKIIPLTSPVAQKIISDMSAVKKESITTPEVLKSKPEKKEKDSSLLGERPDGTRVYRID